MSNDKLTFQVKFWALIGPFLCMLTLFIFFINDGQTPVTLPIVLIIGVLLCWKWKLKGFAGAAALISLSLAYHYTDVPIDERFWHLGMGISTILSLLITALSFEEVEALIDAVAVESRSRLENLWKVDEKLQQNLAELKKKKERIRESNVKLSSYQKLLDRSSEEVVELKANNQKILHELDQANKELETLRKEHTEPLYQDLAKELEEKESSLSETSKELLETQEKLFKIQKENQEIQEVEEALERHLLSMEKEQEQQDAAHEQELKAIDDMITSFVSHDKG